MGTSGGDRRQTLWALREGINSYENSMGWVSCGDPTAIPVSPTLESVGLTNIPLPLTSFLGREQEIVEIKQLLPTTRLLTLTGPGGVGKTRLAVHVAAELQDQYRDGVWLVDLSCLRDPACIPHVIAEVLGVKEEKSCPLIDSLKDHLRSRQLLLILDTCDHLVAGCAALADSLLNKAPYLQLLATSREPLRILGERIWPVAPLAVPDSRHVPEVDHLLRFDAVHLFVDRARVNQPDFAISRQNASTVAQICSQLDGLPLAIELAAARVRMFPVHELLRRLEDSLGLLTGGHRTAPPRHQTLRATIDWSYDLLSPLEQQVFNRLAVFAGGWTLEMAEAVIAGEGVEAGSVLDLVGVLVDKSLVMVERSPNGVARYRLQETLRQYGLQRLAVSQVDALIRRRHADYFLTLAEEAEHELLGAAQAEWLDRLEREHANLRAAMEWTLETGQIETEVRLAGALWRFLYLSDYLGNGQPWIERAVALLRTSESMVPASIQANALNASAALAALRNEYPIALESTAESLQIFRRIGDRVGIATTLALHGAIARFQGDLAAAVVCGEESLALFRDLGNRWGIAVSLSFLAAVAEQQGDYRRAEALRTEELAVRRELGHPWGIARILLDLGSLALRQDDPERANALLLNGLALRRDMGDRSGIAVAVEKLASVAAVRGAAEQAARLSGMAAALREALGAPAPDCRGYDRMLTAVQTELGDEGFRTAWEAGRSMPLEQVIGVALIEEQARPSAPTVVEPNGKGRACPLTEREREVAALVAQGLTNREIASRLVLSKRTIDAHIANILKKLDFAGRAQIAVWIAKAQPPS